MENYKTKNKFYYYKFVTKAVFFKKNEKNLSHTIKLLC
jgi:hypothetical protein